MLQRNKREAAADTQTVVIKKYENRRLYDTHASRYVNFDDIARMIRDGDSVQVIDAKTRKDITRVILTQIITEDVREKPAGLPLELLRQLIVATDQTRQEFLMWYLKSAFDTYQSVQDALQNRLGEMQSAILSPVQSVRRLLGNASPAGGNEEVIVLRKRVADLERRLIKKKNGATNGGADRGTRRK